MTISDFLGGDHGRCDNLYAAAEQAAADGDWAAAREANEAFLEAMAHHFAMEEEVLFPAFEEASGAVGGPTMVMRHEHEQMRQLFAAMREAADAGDADGFLGSAETLLILMQQHNAKEEQILYPMSDRVLGNALGDLLARMEQIAA